MKLKLIALLALFPVGLFAQSLAGDNVYRANLAQNFKTYLNFTATSDDSTGYVTLNSEPTIKADVLAAREVRLIGIATDSVNADVYVVARNRFLTGVTETYADSITGTSNTSNTTVITLRSSTVDRLTGCTEIKVGTVFRATKQGTTAGRTLKWYLEWVK